MNAKEIADGLSRKNPFIAKVLVGLAAGKLAKLKVNPLTEGALTWLDGQALIELFPKPACTDLGLAVAKELEART